MADPVAGEGRHRPFRTERTVETFGEQAFDQITGDIAHSLPEGV